MARKIQCDGCGFEEPLRPDPSVKEARYESADGTILSAELCARCRKSIADVFPHPHDLDVPEFLRPAFGPTLPDMPQPKEAEWDGIDRSELS